MLAPTAALVVALVVAAPAAWREAGQPPTGQKAEPRPPSREPQTTQTVDATRGMRLALENFAGEVVVRAWDKDAVRVDARHMRNVKITVNRKPDGLLEVEASGDRAVSGSVDYELSVPAWMPVSLSGMYLTALVEGVRADITVETVHGDVTVRGGDGSISLKSIEGHITLSGAKGRIQLHSTEGDVSVEDSSGEVAAETIEGTVTLTRLSAKVVDASTLDGTVVYDGAIAAQGQYQFATHDGSVILRIPETTNATVTVRTYEGSVNSSFSVQPSGDYKRGRRVSFTLGKGGAEIDIEAFDGQIRLLKAGEALPEGKKKN